MLTFYKSRFTKNEISLLKRALQEAQYYIRDVYVDCSLNCSECTYRSPCKDLQRIIRYMDTVENSVETVENKKKRKNS